MKNKLYLISVGNSSFYCGAPSLEALVKLYPNATKIEHISDKVVFSGEEGYNLLKKVYEFFKLGPHVFSVEEKNNLQDQIKQYLDL